MRTLALGWVLSATACVAAPPNAPPGITSVELIETARFDEVLDPQTHSSALARRIPSAREIVRPVGHFAYVPLCKPVLGALIARAAGVPICNDADGVDRASVHRQVAADVVAFFDQQFNVRR
jgi:predicted dienelactone hydrolase